ncbi:MAG: pyridoxal phosphate-dependent aminotransferase [Bacteroidota bacterium]
MEQFLSHRTKALPSSATLAIYQQTRDLIAWGYDVRDLSIGEPSFPTPAYIQQAAKQAIDAGAYFGYPPTAGYADLRAAIAQKLRRDNGIVCEPSQIVVSTGAKQALANICLCLLDPGDEVVVYTPYWLSYVSLIRLAGGKPVFIKGKQEDNFEPKPEQLDRAITPRTKAILFSSPCNPTGLILSESSLMAIAAVLAQHKHVLVVADEIYEYINFTDSYTSIGALEGMQDRVITVNGFSKGFAMTGWRVGYLAAPTWVAKACEKIQGQLTAATCSIAQRAALAAIEGGKTLLQGMADAYRQRRDLAMQLLDELPGFKLNKPLGAFYLFPDISYYFGQTDGQTAIHNANDFCMYILQEAHVALVAGSAFGEPRCIRLSYAVGEEDLQEAIQRIRKVLHRLRPSL